MISYKPLLQMLFDRDMSVSDLKLPPSVSSKFKKNGHVSTATLEKICLLLNCKIQDVIDITPDSAPPKQG